VPLRPWVEVLHEAEVDPQKFQSSVFASLADAAAGVSVKTAKPVMVAANILALLMVFLLSR
jgi:hypothetical protein